MGTKQQLLSWASAQVGTVGGSKYWQMVYGWSGNGLAWCAVFDSAALQATNTKCFFFPKTYAFDYGDPGVSEHAINRYALQAGDMVSFDWDKDGRGDHVGIVEKVLGYGVYQTIEGNVSNSCGRRTRYASDIICGLRPQYSDASDKLVVDGVFGYMTISALQSALQKRGFYKGYIVDGDWGYYSKLETQKYLRKLGYYGTGYLLDGDFGYYSVKALQTYLRKLGYTDSVVDGYWGSLTTKALQKALNAGKF